MGEGDFQEGDFSFRGSSLGGGKYQDALRQWSVVLFERGRGKNIF